MKRVLVIFGFFVVLAVIAFGAWRLLPTGQTYFTDAVYIKEPASSAPVRDILWEPPQPLADPINEGGETYEPRRSNDGTTLYFVRGKAGQDADIYFATRTREGWSDPQSILAVNSKADELGPEISADGQSLYFYSNRAGGLGGYDLWMTRRGEDGEWREPVNLGPRVNSGFNDYGAALTADGRTLFFSSNRPLEVEDTAPNPRAWSATLREEFVHRTYDLYIAELTDAGAGPARPLDALNTPHNEGAPAVSAFGDFLYFASDRPGGQGGFDLYRARRLRGALCDVENLGAAVNTAAHELDPALSMNGFGLDFSSNRSRPGDESAEGEYRLYHTHSREVFLETEYADRTAIDWAALWRTAAPNLLWALLALALLLLMLLFFKGAQNRKLSLMARCLLASVALHLLLMVLFNVWEVAAALAGDFQRGAPIKVSLTGAASHEIAAQLTASLSDGSAPAMASEYTRPQEMPDPVPPWQSAEIPLQRTPIAFAESVPAPLQATDAPTGGVPIQRPDFTPSIPTPPRNLEVEIPKAADQIAVEERAPQPVTPHNYELQRSSAAVPVQEPMERPESKPEPARRVSLTASDVPSVVRLESLSDAPVAVQLAMERPYMPPAQPSLSSSKLASMQLPETSVALSAAEPAESIPTPTLEPPARTVTGTTHDSIAPAPIADAQVVALSRSTLHDSSNAVLSHAPTVHDSDARPLSAITDPIRLPETPRMADISRATFLDLPFDREDLRPSANQAEMAQDHRPTLLASRSLAHGPMDEGIVAPHSLVHAQHLGWTRLIDDGSAQSVKIRLEVADAKASITREKQSDATPSLAKLDESPRALLLDLPDELAPPENPYPQRAAQDRLEKVKRMGGTEATEAAVELALKWLARHQHPDGRWDADGFDDDCGECGGTTTIAADHALTGLGLLCFLGAGHTHAAPGPYQDNVDRAIRWLVEGQKPDGDLRGSRETMYTQGIATIALAEAYAMTGDTNLRDAVRRAAGFIYRARNPQAGGWRYDPGQAGDTSVLGWQVMALKSTARAGISVPDHAFTHAGEWMGRVSRHAAPGLYSYQPGEEVSPSMTAEGLFVQQLLGLPLTDPRMTESVAYVLRHLPEWNADAPTYFWYYASLALFQHQGEAWRVWNAAMSRELVEHQRRDGKAAGSWDPTDQWSRLGGRVYQTALCTLMLEVYYRYLPMYAESALLGGNPEGETLAADEIIGTIRGTVTDHSTRQPLVGAQVRLVLSDRDTISAMTDRQGRYILDVPATPDFFALSASLNPFVPRTVSVERAQLEGRRELTVNFALEPPSRNALVTEAAPDVHHLGDDRFSGDINSQFQKKSEGARFSIVFEIGDDALAVPLQQAELRLLTKGVQRRHKLFVNDRLLSRRLDNSPSDGSFGELIAPFDPALLVAGRNSLRIEALPSDDDIDDFEFVNVRVYLVPLTGPELGQGASIKLDSGAGTNRAWRGSDGTP